MVAEILTVQMKKVESTEHQPLRRASNG